MAEVTRKHLQILGGRWVRHFQLARATSIAFTALWRQIGRGPERGTWDEDVVTELLLACAMCPFYVTDLRKVTSDIVSFRRIQQGCRHVLQRATEQEG